MLVLGCEGCGAEVPPAIASPDVYDCPFCGHRGPTPAEVAARLGQARQLLLQTSDKRRQFGSLHARLVRDAATGRTFKWVALGVLATLFITVSSMSLLSILMLVDYALPVGIATLTTFIVIDVLLVQSARRRVILSAAATPPLGPRGQYACRVCGAPLSADGSALLLRCSHCRADNLVSPSALSEVGRLQQRFFARTAEEAQRAADRAFAFMGCAAFGLPLVWVVAIAAWLVAVTVAQRTVELDVDVSEPYALVDVRSKHILGGRGRCLAKRNPMSSYDALLFGEIEKQKVLSGRGPKTLRPETAGVVNGREIFLRGERDARRFVEAVYRKPFTKRHFARLRRGEDRHEIALPPDGPVLCLVEPESAWSDDRERSALTLDD